MEPEVRSEFLKIRRSSKKIRLSFASIQEISKKQGLIGAAFAADMIIGLLETLEQEIEDYVKDEK
jgi:hypothetical protein